MNKFMQVVMKVTIRVFVKSFEKMKSNYKGFRMVQRLIYCIDLDEMKSWLAFWLSKFDNLQLLNAKILFCIDNQIPQVRLFM